jgi:hypothetical protein
VDQRHSLSQQSDLGRLSQQGSGKSEEAHRLAAEPRGESLHETESAVLRWDRNTHGDSTQHMAQPIERDDNEKSESDATQCSKDRLHADFADDIPKQKRAQQ